MRQTHRDGRLLIYAPVPLFHSVEHGFLLEDQACNGLRLWAENFEHVSVMMPVANGVPPETWKPIETVGPNLERINVIPLPEAYRPDRFFRLLPKVVPIIKAEIERADYLSFSIGGIFGDWGSVSCILAHRMKRSYAVWTDRVESEVVRLIAHEGSWRQRLRAGLTHRPMAQLERYLIRRASLGLFHGRETFDSYARYCRNPQIVHDIHIKKDTHISQDQLQAKCEAAMSGTLRIGYTGRLSPMKGPLDWLAVLKRCAEAGVDFQAIWLGDGSLIDEMKTTSEEQGLSNRVSFPGFVSDRRKILNSLQSFQIFLFCHKTPESPRCLIEALAAGTPIVGYDDAFARDLINSNGGGCLVPRNDTEALAQTVIRLADNRASLSELMKQAAKSGSVFCDDDVFKHRSDIIKEHLSSRVAKSV